MANRTPNNLFSPSFVVIHLTLAFAVGIALAHYLTLPPYPILLPATFSLGMVGLLTLCLTKKRWHPLAIVFFLLIGLCLGSTALAPRQPAHHLANLIKEQREVTLTGVLAKAAEHGLDKTTLVIDCQGIFIPANTSLPVATEEHAPPKFQQTTGLARISMRGSPTVSLLPGDHILARAKIGPPQGFNNPGSFNLRTFLASQDIFISGWISSAHSLIRLETPADRQVFSRYGPERLRAELISFLDRHLPAKHSTLYRALITGDRSGLAPTTLELFRSLGIIHLLAISGLHMALLAGAVMAVSFWLLQRSETILLSGAARQLSVCAAIIPLMLYCLIAGLQTPALRALLMALIFISALLSNRQWHGLTNISLAALVILIANPLALTMVSFQLSFAAVTGIILILPHVRHLFTKHEQTNFQRKISGYIFGSIAVSLAASLTTLPLLLFHFNRFALGGPLATLVIEPFLCIWALGWGLTASLVSPLIPGLALIFFKIGGLGLDIALFIAEKIQPLARSVWLPTPSLTQVILFYSGFLVLSQTTKIGLRVPAILCCLWLIVPLRPDLITDQVTILDVGQGNSTLIETSSGHALLIDAGGPRSPSFDVGRQVIAPALWAKGIRTLDLLVLSHPDQDHYSGAAFILEHFHPKTLWVPTKIAHDPGWQKILAIADKQQTTIRIPEVGELFQLAKDRELSCLADLHLVPQQKQNNQSLVMRFTSAGQSLLIPGDIEHDGERQLISNGGQLASSAIIAPHHGSASSSSRPFLDAVSPQTVIFSASRYKKPHFPSPRVMERYSQIGARPLHTAEGGAITLIFQPQGLETRTWQ